MIPAVESQHPHAVPRGPHVLWDLPFENVIYCIIHTSALIEQREDGNRFIFILSDPTWRGLIAMFDVGLALLEFSNSFICLYSQPVFNPNVSRAMCLIVSHVNNDY